MIETEKETDLDYLLEDELRFLNNPGRGTENYKWR